MRIGRYGANIGLFPADIAPILVNQDLTKRAVLSSTHSGLDYLLRNRQMLIGKTQHKIGAFSEHGS